VIGPGLVTLVLALTAATAGAIYRHSPAGQIRRARRHYDRAVTRVDNVLAARAQAAAPIDPAQQRDLDLAAIWQIWDHTLNHEMGADQ
jgi:hypothetical protein